MNIRSISNPYGAHRVASSTSPVSAKTGDAAAAAPAIARQDSISISDAGRALASDGASKGSLTPERIADLRKKVLEGAYNSAHVVDTVAKRMLSAGDV